MTIGERIREARKSKGLTQKQLADKLQISYVNISQLERNERDPKHETIMRIASALNLSYGERDILLWGEVDREYELICDTLNSAGIKVEQGLTSDSFLISYANMDDTPKSIDYPYLAFIVKKALQDAETHKNMYLKKRLETELFFRENWPEI